MVDYRLAHTIGDNCLFVGNTCMDDEGNIQKLPDFKTEDGVVILLDSVEAEAELRLRKLDG